MTCASRATGRGLLATAVALAVSGCGENGAAGSTNRDSQHVREVKKPSSPSSNRPEIHQTRGITLPPAGIRLQVSILSPARAQIRLALGRPSEVSIRVKRIAGRDTTKVGKLKLGTRPKGQTVFSWDLAVKGKRLTPGRYTLIARTDAGTKSRPVVVTIRGR